MSFQELRQSQASRLRLPFLGLLRYCHISYGTDPTKDGQREGEVGVQYFPCQHSPATIEVQDETRQCRGTTMANAPERKASCNGVIGLDAPPRRERRRDTSV